MKSMFRPIVSVMLLVLSVLGLLNVYGDNADVVTQARAVACPGCDLNQIREGRSPIAQKFEFQMDHSSQIARVTCQRALVLIGDYSCVLTP